MPIIKIQRPNEILNRFRNYHIYIDGQKIEEIANGETKDFQITEGKHSVIAKIDWCSSSEINIDIAETQTKIFKVSGFKNANWILYIGFILIILGSVLNRFLESEWGHILLVFPS